MEKYFLFVNSSVDYLLLPAKNFIGAKYSSATIIDLYFEKSPLSYKIPLTVTDSKGEEVARQIAEIIRMHPKSVIKFSDIESSYAIEDVTAVGTFTHIVTQ
tara:strand:- start:10245 stop:10547 length:303 start_codon:yes stop_codon:yes gene_type:complete